AEDGIRDRNVTGVQTCALPICILDYSRLNDMTIQAWSPFQYGHFEGVYIDHPDFPVLNEQLQTIADKQNVSKSAVAIAWILRHPAQIQSIIGSMKPERIQS